MPPNEVRNNVYQSIKQKKYYFALADNMSNPNEVHQRCFDQMVYFKKYEGFSIFKRTVEIVELPFNGQIDLETYPDLGPRFKFISKFQYYSPKNAATLAQEQEFAIKQAASDKEISRLYPSERIRPLASLKSHNFIIFKQKPNI